jgi:hypothetical protein
LVSVSRIWNECHWRPAGKFLVLNNNNYGKHYGYS